ncbi:hypothetical protein EOK75_06550 [Pseudorhodobacter turbinis]|uniref:Uncharacterized protein n=1 Tax=Pseudorhodobacter turbinis TaxID=2500533 RepID=A0A4P8EF78_9RHOB|nr:hypothetical protein [Pseudorhodobacter turbinis]QCO55447.1 hypothetical protein EOK75_06550 [Pseudorhodobacter turbinis]
MSNEVTLSDESLAGFSQPAKDRLRAATVDYLDELISESYRLEASMNSDNGPTEITQGMVNDAVVFKKRLPTKKKWKFWRVVTRVAGSLLPLLVGFFFNSDKLTDGNNLVLFALLLVVTAVVITVSVLMDV